MTVQKVPSELCYGCGHPKSGHYRGPDPDYPNLDSAYCGEDGCLCWDRFSIARHGPVTRMTPERKPPKP